MYVLSCHNTVCFVHKGPLWGFWDTLPNSNGFRVTRVHGPQILIISPVSAQDIKSLRRQNEDNVAARLHQTAGAAFTPQCFGQVFSKDARQQPQICHKLLVLLTNGEAAAGSRFELCHTIYFLPRMLQYMAKDARFSPGFLMTLPLQLGSST